MYRYMLLFLDIFIPNPEPTCVQELLITLVGLWNARFNKLCLCVSSEEDL